MSVWGVTLSDYRRRVSLSLRCAAPSAGYDVGASEEGADFGAVQVTGDCLVIFEGHDDVDVHRTVGDLSGTGHLGGQCVVGDDVLGGVVFGHGRDREAVHGTDQADDCAVGDVKALGFIGHSLHQLSVADLDDNHDYLPIMGLRACSIAAAHQRAPASRSLTDSRANLWATRTG